MKNKDSYLNFERVKYSEKTFLWHITSGETYLGKIKWYAPWRRYCLFPSMDTLFDSKCLKEITKFIDLEMLKRKEGTCQCTKEPMWLVGGRCVTCRKLPNK